jgi:hypothetical protein
MPAALIIQLVIAVLSAIPQLVQAAEALHDSTGAGPAKKGFVMDAVGKLLTIATTADPKLAKLLTPDLQKQITDVSSSAVDSAVAVLNAPVKPAA